MYNADMKYIKMINKRTMIIKYLGILLLFILAGFVIMKLTEMQINVDTVNKSPKIYNGNYEESENYENK